MTGDEISEEYYFQNLDAPPSMRFLFVISIDLLDMVADFAAD